MWLRITAVQLIWILAWCVKRQNIAGHCQLTFHFCSADVFSWSCFASSWIGARIKILQNSCMTKWFYETELQEIYLSIYQFFEQKGRNHYTQSKPVFYKQNMKNTMLSRLSASGTYRLIRLFSSGAMNGKKNKCQIQSLKIFLWLSRLYFDIQHKKC